MPAAWHRTQADGNRALVLALLFLVALAVFVPVTFVFATLVVFALALRAQDIDFFGENGFVSLETALNMDFLSGCQIAFDVCFVVYVDRERTGRGLHGQVSAIAGKDGHSLGLRLSIPDFQACRGASVRAALPVLVHLRSVRRLGPWGAGSGSPRWRFVAAHGDRRCVPQLGVASG